MKGQGRLIMIPVPIATDAWHTLPAEVYEVTKNLRYYFAENAKTARRMLRGMHRELKLEEIQMSEIDKHTGPDIPLLKQWLKDGLEVGVMSESGCPGIADPGALLAQVAHSMGAIVKPLTGPSSILLSLMASGLNGQSFAFHGYLPVKDPARSSRMRQLEQVSAQEKQTQIFIETPYRNNAILADMMKVLQPNTRLCIAYNMGAKDEFISTKTVKDWKQQLPELSKEPCVFLFLAT